jgi:hypothetical protein
MKKPFTFIYLNLKTIAFAFLALANYALKAQVAGDTTKTNSFPNNNLQSGASATSSSSNEDKKFSPNFSPLSPNAAGIQKFQDFQVNLSAGSPNISIPIFTASSGNINLPINLRYGAANGHTLTDLASWVGWGWSLDLGVSMNRSIRGAADDIPSTNAYMNSNSGFDWDLCDNGTDYTNAQFANGGFYDLEPDVFSYSIGSASGKFYFKKQTLEPFLIPYQPVKIISDFTNSSRITKWEITGPDGQKYLFGKDKNNNLIRDWQSTDGIEEGLGTNGAVTWHLTEIQSPNTTDKIEVEYYPEDIPLKVLKLLTYSWSAAEVTSGPGLSQSINPVSKVQARNNTQRYIKKINFDNGYIEFIVSSNTEIREDQPEAKYLKRIDVYNYEEGQAHLIKSIRFNYSYFTDRTGANARLKLDKIEDGNADFSLKTETSFEYFTNNFSWKYNPGATGADIEDFKKQDYFGYYNGIYNNHLFDIESYVLKGSDTNTPVSVIGGKANRDTGPQFLFQGVLKKIKLPSGGFTEFQFEPQQFKLNNVVRLGGGLRVKAIINKPDLLTDGSLKTYSYSSDDGLNIGKLTNTWSLPATKVIGYQNFKSNEGISETIFFSPDGDLSLNPIDGTPIYYTLVKEFSEIGTNELGYKEHEFSFYRDTQLEGIQNSVYDLQPWKRGLLLSEKIFDKNNILVSSTTNVYQEFKAESYKNIGKVFNRNVGATFSSCPSGMPNGFNGSDGTSGGGFANADELTFFSNISKTGTMKLIRTNSFLEGVEVVSNFTYDDKLFQISQTSFNSKNELLKSETIYSTNSIYNSNPIALKLRAQNMIVPLESIQSVEKQGVTKITSRQKTIYYDFPGINSSNYVTNLLPSEVWVAKDGSVLEKRVEYVSYYTNGNPREYKVDGQPSTLIWGYDDNLLIGEIKNATWATVSNLMTTNNISTTEFSVTNLNNALKNKLLNFQNSLSEALTNWYTYRPLVGVSEKYEVNGIKSSYEYDSLLRLSFIKDSDGKLIKSYKYNYKGTQ